MPAFTQVGVEAVVKNLDGFNRGLDSMSVAIGNLAAKAVEVGVQAIAKLGQVLVDVGKFSFDAAIDFESAFAGVIKTTDGLVDETGNLTEAGKELQEQFRGLAKEVPIAVEELLGIGELGGQLGVGKEDLLEFTEAIAAVGVSTNVTVDEAATQFAQIANIMGTTEREGSEAFSKIGSAIVALGNNFVATEADVLNFASRIAGAGQVAGLTEADVFGIGAAFSSVGIAAEAGGTAVQKVLLGINESVLKGGSNLETFAGISGLTVEDFTKLWEEDAGEAFAQFVNGLGVAGDDAVFVLEELGLTDQRLTRAFLSLAGAGDLVNETIDLSSEAWAENAALQKEAAQRYATTESQIAIMKNVIKDLGITVGSFLLPIFNQALQAVRPFIEQFAEWISTTIPIAMEILSAFWNNTLLPVFSEIGQWLGTLLPTAIQEGTNFWTNVLLPAIMNVWAFITNTLIPVFQTIWAWLSQFLTAAIDMLVAQWNDIFLPTILKLAELWTSTILPALTELWIWLQTTIPLAIEELSSFWTDILLPTLAAVWAWIRENLFPVFAQIVAWLIEQIPVAIETAATFWEETLKPALQTISTFIIETLLPAMTDVWNWLIENWPVAIETVSTFWEETLKPALETVWTFITETLIPTFETVVAWLQETIPIAIEVVKIFWEEVFKPALEAVWTFITESLIPIFETVVGWLEENIPVAIETVSTFWEETLLPALEAVWGFIDEFLLPLWEAVEEFLSVTLTLALEALAGIWENILQPALEAVWSDIKDNLMPVFTTLKNFINMFLKPALKTLKTTGFDPLKGAITLIKDTISKLTEKFESLTAKLKALELPEWMQPGSPPPLFFALQDINRAMNELTSKQLPRMSMELDTIAPKGGAFLAAPTMAAAGATMSASPVMQNTVNINQNNNISGGMGMAAVEGMVMNIVNRALGTGTR